MTYFDHNATTPLLPVARQAWLEAAEKLIGNPSSPHRVGARADAALTDARQRLAAVLGCDPLDIVWTSGATESNNMVLHHLARSLDAEAEVWVSAIEHPCVLEATVHYFPRRHRFIPVNRSGVVDLDWVHKEITKRRPGMIALMAANNETGVLQPWGEVLSLCREWEVTFFCDAAQWIGKLPAKGLGDCDFVSGCAHKFGGPKGVGFLKCPSKGRVHPLLLGGPQEERRRAGTENVAGVVAMLAALEAREETLHGEQSALGGAQEGSGARPPRESSSHGKVHGPGQPISSAFSTQPGAVRLRLGWREAFEKKLLSAVSGSEIVGANQGRLWNTVSALMPEADARQRWVVKLDKLGFAVSTGSACASGKEAPSHVIAGMGYSSAQASRVLRFSSGWETKPEEWDSLAEALEKVFHEMRPSESPRNRTLQSGPAQGTSRTR